MSASGLKRAYTTDSRHNSQRRGLCQCGQQYITRPTRAVGRHTTHLYLLSSASEAGMESLRRWDMRVYLYWGVLDLRWREWFAKEEVPSLSEVEWLCVM